MFKTDVEKIKYIIQEVDKIKMKVLEAENDGKTVLSEEQARELKKTLRDRKIDEILKED